MLQECWSNLQKELECLKCNTKAWLEDDSFKIQYIDKFMMTEHMLTSHEDRKL